MAYQNEVPGIVKSYNNVQINSFADFKIGLKFNLTREIRDVPIFDTC